MWPPRPAFTEKDVGDLSGKVMVVTGANAGIGKELAGLLFSKNARVYMAARSEAKAKAAIESIQAAHPRSKGELIYIHLDLADLTTVKASADTFLAREDQLHILFNNAGVMTPPQGSKTAQGYELQLGTNNVGSFLFTKLLTPTLVATAKHSPKDTVRVIWVASFAVILSPKGGLDLNNLDYHVDQSQGVKYAVSKVGNFLHAVEFARRYGAGSDGVVSIALNPGNLTTELQRHHGWLVRKLISTFITYPPIHGAYTELFAGLSDQITAESVKTNNWIIPWGRSTSLERKDIVTAAKPTTEGGAGLAEAFWQWTEDQIKPYA
ncbi:hypothetical protein M406DRAFT_36913 [Cryphonectria parasitica EP155]|uniref:Short-chain dehydrogenase n=1 Tax=Cryphonectria parasitica (strain ATCC 38755 / EP155) TaxID=660469 RepID=A0A9P5CPK0_CRYP1|nr:uncharacterized protein M406DRAFT_36913 [Cryphonectria parasitica EP155]KAF3766564.1 hypothetical protein M406DRAFT_36913 [Cryphonectria parasitica EP155]